MTLAELPDLAVRHIDELDLTVDPTLLSVSAHGQSATITVQQMRLMVELCDAWPRGRPRDEDSEAVQDHMLRMRKRLEGIVGIRTIYGVGHALEPIEEDS